MANIALDAVFKSANTGPVVTKDWRKTRYALRAGSERLSEDHQLMLRRLRRTRYSLWRAWELKEAIRALFRSVKPEDARDYLKAWCRSAMRSKLKPFINLARRLRQHFDGIVATVEHGLSNSRLEGINAKIRLINRRGFGHPNPHSLAAMIHLCLGGITIPLPTER
jgi:transposase